MALGNAFNEPVENAVAGGFENLSTNVFSNKTGELLAGSGTLNSSALDNALKLGVKETATNSLSSVDFGKLAGGVGTGLTGLANLWGAYNSWQNGKEQIKEAKRQNDLFDTQRKIENERYDKREAERIKANETIAAAAKLDEKNHLPTNRI